MFSGRSAAGTAGFPRFREGGSSLAEFDGPPEENIFGGAELLRDGEDGAVLSDRFREELFGFRTELFRVPPGASFPVVPFALFRDDAERFLSVFVIQQVHPLSFRQTLPRARRRCQPRCPK